MANWYFLLDEKTGPVEIDRIINLKIDGIIDGTTICYHNEEEGKPFSEWEELCALEEKVKNEKNSVQPAPVPDQVLIKPAQDESLSEIIRKIEKRNKLVSGITLIAAGILLLSMVFKNDLLIYKAKTPSGDQYTGAFMGLQQFGCGGGIECINQDINEENLELRGLEYANNFKQISLSNFKLIGKTSFYSGILLSLMLIAAGFIVLTALSRKDKRLISIAYIVSSLSYIPFLIFTVSIIAFCIAGMSNIVNDSVRITDLYTNEVLTGKMGFGQGFYIAIPMVINILIGYFYAYKLKEG